MSAMPSRIEDLQAEADRQQARADNLADAGEHLLTVLEDLLQHREIAGSGRAVKLRQEAFAAANQLATIISRAYNPVEEARMRPTPEEVTLALQGEEVAVQDGAAVPMTGRYLPPPRPLTATAQSVLDVLTRASLRWQRPADNATFRRMAEMIGLDFDALVADDYEDALLEHWQRQGWEPSELVAAHEVRPLEEVCC